MDNNYNTYDSSELMPQILTTIQELLGSLIIEEHFETKIKLIFGDNVSATKAKQYIESITSDNSSLFPHIEVKSRQELQGVNAGFAGVNNTIYFASEFLWENQNNHSLLVNTLLEELGHSLDWYLNPVDTQGDEGELFGMVTQNTTWDETTLNRIKTENDHITITSDGLEIVLETSNNSLGLIQGLYSTTNSLTYLDYEDSFTFTIAGTGNSSHYIDVYSSSYEIDLVLELYDQYGNLINSADQNSYLYNYETLSLSGLSAGNYTLWVYDYDYGYYIIGTETYSLDINAPQSSTLKSDLTPYQPSGWSDKLVISTTTGANTDVSQTTTNDTLYIDWAYLNQGDTSTSNIISTRLLLDGNVIYTDDWTSSLQKNYYVYDEDIQINPLSAGNHTLKIEVDYLNKETEKIETNNSYSRTFTVINGTQSDLTPYQPTGWSDNLVISNVTGTNTDASQIFANDTLYIDWAYINQGNTATKNAIATRLLLNNNVIYTDNWTTPLQSDYYVYDEDIQVNPLSAGTYTLTLEVDYLNQETETIETNNTFSRTFTVKAGNVAVTDLTPYEPSHWDDKIVVSTVQDTYTNASQITSGDKLYIDWAYANFGEGDTKNPITTRLLIDGNVVSSSTGDTSLPSDYYTWLEDIEVGPLTAGNHTIRLEVDYGNKELETNESNNVYERVITVVGAAKSDLTPYKPDNWDDKIVISSSTGTNKNASQITTQDTVYIDWAYINQGSGDTSKAYKTRLLLDGVEIQVWDQSEPLPSNYYSYEEDFKINPLTAGNHTLKLEVDYLNQETETLETNNTFTRTFTVVSTTNKPDLTPYKPTGWSGQLVLSTQTGTNTDATKFTTDNTLYLDWAQINQGQGATNGSYKTRLLLDGKEIQTWTQTNPLNANASAPITDFNLGKLTAGTHKLRLEIDFENSQAESNENNNFVEKTFTVELTNPTTVPSTGNNAFDLIDIDRLRNDPLYSDIDGSGLSVVVVDTGLWGSHKDLVKNFKAFVDVSGNNFTVTTNPSQSRDTDSHGTHVAGTIGSSNPAIGVAPNVGLIGINYLENFGQNTFNNTFQWILDNRVEYNIVAVNMSLGNAQPTFYTSETNAATIQSYWQNAVKLLEQAGITVISSAGNSYFSGQKEGTGAPGIFSTLNVGGVWQDGKYSNLSWQGGATDYITGADRLMAMSQRLDTTGTYDDTIFAPGALINSTIPNNKYDEYAGTSMASPHVAGVVALMQEAAIKFGGKLLEPTKIAQIIHDTADIVKDGDDENDNVTNTNKTYRRINAYKSIEAVKNYFTNFTSSFTPLGAIPDANGTLNGSILGTIINGTAPVTLTGSLGIDGINTDMGNNDVDLYKFTIAAPGTLTIELKASSQSSQFVPLSNDFLGTLSENPPSLQDVDTLLRLFDANGTEIGFDDNSGEGNFSKVLKTLATGDYFVGVSGAGNRNYDPNKADSGTSGATGNYAISFSLTNDDPNGLTSSATNVSFGTYNTPYKVQEVLGTDNNNTFTVNTSDVDLYKVIIPDNGQLLIDIDTPYNDKFANTYLRIFDKDGKQVFFNDDGLFSSDVLLESNESTNNAQPGKVFQGTTFVGHNTDSFLSGAVKRGETYYIGVSNFNHTSYDPNNFDNRPQGGQDDRYDLTIQFVNNDLNGSITQARSDIPLPVVGVPGLMGKDAVNVNGVNSFKEVGERDVDFVKIKSPTAGILEIEAISSTVDPVQLVARIFDKDGKVLASNHTPDQNGNSLLQLQIEANKDYFASISGLGNSNFDPFLLGSGANGDTGEYTLNMKLLPLTQFTTLSDNVVLLENGTINNTVQTIAVGDIINGDIGQDNSFVIGAADLDIYRFVATTNGKINISTLTSQEFSADTFLRFFNTSGTELAYNDDENNTTTRSFISYNVVAGQTYYIGVNGSSPNARNYNPLTGENVANGSQGYYLLSINEANEALSLEGTPNNDSLTGGDGNDTIQGLAGNDTLDGGAGADTLDGGVGNDTYIVDNEGDLVVETTLGTTGGTDLVKASINYTLPNNVENLTLTGSNNVNGTGNTLSNKIIGNSGNNTLNGSDGNDSLTGGNGNDTLTGGNGNDTLTGGSGNDNLTGGSGNDNLTGGNGTDRVVESGNVNFTLTNTTLTGLGTDTLSGIEQVSLTGGNGNNNLNASAFTTSKVILSGGIGNDTLTSGSGNDNLSGGGGNDNLSGGSGNDNLSGGGGTDRVVESGNVNFTLTNTILTGLGTDTLSSIEQVSLTGGNGNNNLNASAFTTGKVILSGGIGNDTLTGGSSNDSLIGGNGNDTLTGGSGNDTLTGGGGNDSFRFNTKTEGIDTITDFNVANDTILVAKNGFSNSLTVNAPITIAQFMIGSSATTSAHRFGYDGSNGKLWFDSDGNGATASVQIATLSTGLGLTNADIFVV